MFDRKFFKKNDLSINVALVVFVSALISYSYLFFVETGIRAAIPFQVDELWFLTCAARGLAVGDIPISGCHDNKSPLIYAVYQLAMNPSAPYNFINIKIAAFVSGAFLASICGLLGLRLGGRVAALLAASFVLQLFIASPSYLALKTELIGLIFLSIALFLLFDFRAAHASLTSLCAGFFVGLALASNQKFLFPFIGILIWFFLDWLRGPRRSFLSLFKTWCIFCTAASLPTIALFFIFFWNDRQIDFLASLFIYPLIYGRAEQIPFIKQLAWRVALIANVLQPMRLHLLVGVGACAAAWMAWRRAGIGAASREVISPILLVLVIGSYALIALMSPLLFGYHLFPVWCLITVLAGFYIAVAIKNEVFSIPISAALLTVAVLSPLALYGSVGAKNEQGKDLYSYEPVSGYEGKYAYIAGQWPAFYVFNGLIPASDVMYPTALPGAPASWAFTPPDPSSRKGELLRRLYEYNVPRLLNDFYRTPPSLIFVEDLNANSKPHDQISDINVLNKYILANCKFSKRIEGFFMHEGSLFKCSPHH